MAAIDFSQQRQGTFDFLSRQRVRQHQVHHGFDVRATRQIRNRGVADRLVWDGYDVALGIAHPRAAQPDVLHHALNAVQFDLIANPEWFVGKYRYRPEQVGQSILRGQPDRQCADRKRGDCRGDIDADVLGRHHNRHYNDERVQTLAQYGEELIVELPIRFEGRVGAPEVEQEVDDLDGQISQR